MSAFLNLHSNLEYNVMLQKEKMDKTKKVRHMAMERNNPLKYEHELQSPMSFQVNAGLNSTEKKKVISKIIKSVTTVPLLLYAHMNALPNTHLSQWIQYHGASTQKKKPTEKKLRPKQKHDSFCLSLLGFKLGRVGDWGKRLFREKIPSFLYESKQADGEFIEEGKDRKRKGAER